MLFRYLSPMSFGDHVNVIAERVFTVSTNVLYKSHISFVIATRSYNVRTDEFS